MRVLRLVFELKNDKVTVNFMIDTLYYSGRPKEFEGVVCGTYGREHKMHYSVLAGRPEGIDCLNGWTTLTLRLLMSYIYGAPSKARNANVVYIWTYVWQR